MWLFLKTVALSWFTPSAGLEERVLDAAARAVPAAARCAGSTSTPG